MINVSTHPIDEQENDLRFLDLLVLYFYFCLESYLYFDSLRLSKYSIDNLEKNIVIGHSQQDPIINQWAE